MMTQHHVGSFGCLPEVPRRQAFCRRKEEYLSMFRHTALTVAPTSGLRQGIYPGGGPVNDGEIDIDACFDQLGADQSTGPARGQRFPDPVQNARSVNGAHEAAEMICSLRRETFEQSAGMPPRIHNAEDLILFTHSLRQAIIGYLANILDGYAPERFVQPSGIRDDFPDAIQTVPE